MGVRSLSPAPSGGSSELRRVIVVGGAGFIGGHCVDRLLGDPATERVTVYDNFSSGREWHLSSHQDDPRLTVIRSDVGDLDALTRSMEGHSAVVHLASNPDIARAMTEPAVDFDEGTLLTHHVVEAMRRSGARRILYASGSGVYGELGEVEAYEDYGPLVPVSTYGASKLAGEALISAYCYMFDLSGCVFRFGNVVGPRQTHGVGFDFVHRLLEDPSRLRILGDGSQSKSYVHVQDILNAVFLAAREGPTPSRSSTWRPGTTSRCERSPSSHSTSSGARPARRPSSTPAATEDGRATCRSCASTPTGSAPSAGRTRCRRRRRCAPRSSRCSSTHARVGSASAATGNVCAV